MKLALAGLVWLVLGTLLAAGMVLAARGNPWLLVLGGLGYLALFVRYGCLGR